MTALEQMMAALTPTYAVSFDGKAFFCRMCGMASHNPQDVENRYCGHCHCFHDNEALERVLAQRKANP